MQLHSDPAFLAPERLVVFELTGTVQGFRNAATKIDGLQWVAEEDLPEDQHDKNPCMYLLIPNNVAFREILTLWRKWTAGEKLERGFSAWAAVFAQLRDLRPWGPKDRVQADAKAYLQEVLEGLGGEEPCKVEIELIFRKDEEKRKRSEKRLTNYIVDQGGSVVARCSIPDIAYHALLVELPAKHIEGVLAQKDSSVLVHDDVMFIRPQSVADNLPLEGEGGGLFPDNTFKPEGEPILALLDGYPVSRHPILGEGLRVVDLFDLGEQSGSSKERSHGTGMASLIVRGDLQDNMARPLPRPITCIPVMADDKFSEDALVADRIYQAIMRLREGKEAIAPHTIIVNLSLGDARRPFCGMMSPWARLLDYLAYKFGILFLVSAGNDASPFLVRGYRKYTCFADEQEPRKRAALVWKSLDAVKADRRILSPAEAINSLTVGAYNRTWGKVGPNAGHVNPYGDIQMANPSSRLGPGFRGSTKPDILMPGGCEHLRTQASGEGVRVEPFSVGRWTGGLMVASSRADRGERGVTYTGHTSAAAALASRTAHLIHDALERNHGQDFLEIAPRGRVAILKALLVHSASWNEETVQFLHEQMGAKKAMHKKDDIRRFMGYGCVNPECAVSCAEDRATFWAHGTIEKDQSITVNVPIPACINGKAKLHSFDATLAWLSPTMTDRMPYRGVKLVIVIEKEDRDKLNVETNPNSPEQKQTEKGTVCTYRKVGTKAPNTSEDEYSIPIRIVRSKDDFEGVHFGLVVTLSMFGETGLYEQARARVESIQTTKAKTAV